MTDTEYAQRRLIVHEQATRNLMAFICASFPHMAETINRIGWEWDKQIDKLDAAAPSTDKPTGGA